MGEREKTKDALAYHRDNRYNREFRFHVASLGLGMVFARGNCGDGGCGVADMVGKTRYSVYDSLDSHRYRVTCHHRWWAVGDFSGLGRLGNDSVVCSDSGIRSRLRVELFLG